MVDHLSSRYSSADACVAYVYCDYRDKNHQTVTDIINSLLKQVLNSMPTIPNVIVELLLMKKKARTKLELSDACNVLAQALSSFASSFLCIDALDECADDERWYLINSLQQLVIADSRSSQPLSIKLFLTGRPQIEGYLQWHPAVDNTIVSSVTLEANRDDIVKFINHKMNMDKNATMPQEFKEQIINEIVSTSNGMLVQTGSPKTTQLG